MNEVTYINDTDRTVYVGGKQIRPRESRQVSAAAAVARKGGGAPVSSGPEDLDNGESGDVLDLLSGTVAQIAEALPELSDDQLAMLRDAENTADRPRTTLLSAIDEELLIRTDEGEGGGGEEGGGEGEGD